MQQTRFVQVLLPLPLPKTYTYRVPRELNNSVQTGIRVLVQFGKKKIYSGLVVEIHHNAPTGYEAKYILSLLDDQPVIHPEQLKLWSWVSTYYLTTMGEVMLAAIPGGMNLNSETKVLLHPEFDGEVSSLTEREYMVLEALEEEQKLGMDEVAKLLEVKSAYGLIKKMIDKKVVMVEEEVKRRYKPKKTAYVSLNPGMLDEKKLEQAFNDLSNAPKQVEVLTAFLQLSDHFQKDRKKKYVALKKLKKRVDASASVINELVKKDILGKHELEESRLVQSTDETTARKELSSEQQRAFDEIQSGFQLKDACLLHGVTSSGKTEIYVKLIDEVLQAGKQVLYLLPEIALTTQLIIRLRAYFGDKVGVFHSRFNENERVEVWKELLKKNKSRFQLIVGARSSVFLPFSSLGLIIVDEEHESTFKQFEPSPRYQARDLAVVLANIFNAKVLMGTATPSLESYYNAQSGKYGYVQLNSRYLNIKLPEIFVADLAEARKKKRIKGVFSELLLNAIREALKDNEQVILFKNRRGFSPFLQCETCGWVPHCTRCDISLTYHKYRNDLMCHYCGYRIDPPTICGACGSKQIKTRGFGTERIEEELSLLFPEITVKRMDLDTTRSKNAYGNLISDFDEGEIEILIGTQMISKGLDFKNVSLVGVIDADGMLSYPDFRAHERAFQLMAQVSGRAGRFKKRGKVVIQSANPYHFIIQQVVNGNYEKMAGHLLSERKRYSYPPFTRLIKITIKHKEQGRLNKLADDLGRKLRQEFKEKVYGPEFPVVARIRNLYNKNILLKLDRDKSLKQVKFRLKEIKDDFIAQNNLPPNGVIIDVDPM